MDREEEGKERAVCTVCCHHCALAEGQTGRCRARRNVGGEIVCDNYGRLTALALDPIEKKPLARFCPGSRILSVGSYGCNLSCPFCQNHEISFADAGSVPTRYVPPQELCDLALRLRDQGNIGVAFTYNEALVGWEYVRDCASLVKKAGMKTVLVSNGMASQEVLSALLPLIDAMNIDFKGMQGEYYRRVLGGDRDMVMAFIEGAAGHCHLEITTLIVPGENDTPGEMRRISSWIAGLDGGRGEIPLHVSRFFPRHQMLDRGATDVDLVYALAEVARERLRYVYTGNC